MKKLFTMALALIMALSLAVPAMAASITVNDAINGHTYDAYKIFDVTYTDSNNSGAIDDADAYSYTIDSTGEWWNTVVAYAGTTADSNGVYSANGLTLTPVSGTTLYVVSVDIDGQNDDDFSAADFAIALNAAKTGKAKVSSPAAANETATIPVTSAGYYFVDSSMGALCVLNTADDTVTVLEKNSAPVLEKEVQEADGGAWGASNYANMGETVEFKITVTPGAGDPDVDWVITDTMADGFQTPANFVVTIDGNEIEEIDANWTNAVTDNDFVLTLKKEMLIANDVVDGNKKAIVITYDAVLDSDAVLAGNGNVNTAVLTWGGTDNSTDSTTTYTYQYSLLKVDGQTDAALSGVQFQLSEGDQFGTAIAFVETEVGSYRLPVAGDTAATTTTLTTGTDGVITVKGLDGNTDYTLRETATLAGYNLLKDDVTFNIGTDNSNYDAATDANVIENNTGVLLPSTGGMGTTIFYTLGGLLVAGAVVLLVTRKRVEEAEV